MKIFISHRFTGENINELKSILTKIVNPLEQKNHDVFCSTFKCDFFEEQKYTTDEIYEYCNNVLIEHDMILFLIKSAEPSRGMQLELDVAIKHNKKIFLLIQKDLEFNNFREFAHTVIEFRTIKNINLDPMV